MQPSPEAKRLRTAFDLFEAGVRLMQARFQRSRPQASSAEIEDLLTAWILERPGAPLGDVAGETAPRPRLQ